MSKILIIFLSLLSLEVGSQPSTIPSKCHVVFDGFATRISPGRATMTDTVPVNYHLLSADTIPGVTSMMMVLDDSLDTLQFAYYQTDLFQNNEAMLSYLREIITIDRGPNHFFNTLSIKSDFSDSALYKETYTGILDTSIHFSHYLVYPVEPRPLTFYLTGFGTDSIYSLIYWQIGGANVRDTIVYQVGDPVLLPNDITVTLNDTNYNTNDTVIYSIVPLYNSPLRIVAYTGAELFKVDSSGHTSITGSLQYQDSTEANGYVLTSDSFGNAKWQPPGIGSVTSWSLTGNSGSNSQTNFIGTTDTGALSIRTKGREAIHIDSSQQMGVGTSSPTALLQIGDSLLQNGSFRYIDGNQATGYVQTSDSLGDVTWQAVPFPDTSILVTQRWADSAFISIVDTAANARIVATPAFVDSAINNTAWSLTGNSGTSPVANFIGTTDMNDLVVKVNNAEIARYALVDSIGNPAFIVNSGTDVIMGGNQYLYGKVGGFWYSDGDPDGAILQPVNFTRDTTLNMQNGYQIGGTTALRQDNNSGNLVIGGNTPYPGSSFSELVAVGFGCLQNNTTGGGATAIGYGAMNSNTTGNENTAVGTGALQHNTTGGNNTAVGMGSLMYNTTGFYNTVMGENSMISLSTGSYNTAIGGDAAVNIQTDSFRLFIQPLEGYDQPFSSSNPDSLWHLIYGNASTNNSQLIFNARNSSFNGNVGIGVIDPVGSPLEVAGSAYFADTTYQGAISIGVNTSSPTTDFQLQDGTQVTGYVLTTDSLGNASWQAIPFADTAILATQRWADSAFISSGDTSSNARIVATPAFVDSAIGNSVWSLTGNTGTHPSTNFIGTTDDQNLIFKVNNFVSGAIGTLDGSSNTFFGYQSLNASIGSNNVAFGLWALRYNTTGTSNCAFGQQSLRTNTTGYQNIAIGRGALQENITGSNNVAVGHAAFLDNYSGSAITGIGAYTDVMTDSLNNGTAVGASALLGRSSTLILGDSTVGGTEIGIGTSFPQAYLDVEAWDSDYVAVFNGGNLGIGTYSPEATLQIGDSSLGNATLKYIDGNQATGYVLTSDSLGNASWQVIPFADASILATLRWADSAFISTADTVANARIVATPAFVDSSISNSSWLLTGNTGTNSQTNFIGTTDTAALSIRTEGLDAIYIDSAQRVGIGTSSPTALLQIGDSILQNGSFRFIDGYQAPAYVLTSDSLGNASWQAMPSADTTILATQRWADSAFIPTSDTVVNARIVATPAFVDSSISNSSWLLTGNTGTNSQTNFIGTTDTAALSIRTNGVEAIHVDSSQQVGVGTSSPSALLQVGDSVLQNGSFRYIDGSQAAGYVLTSDSIGKANWQPVKPAPPGSNCLTWFYEGANPTGQYYLEGAGTFSAAYVLTVDTINFSGEDVYAWLNGITTGSVIAITNQNDYSQFGEYKVMHTLAPDITYPNTFVYWLNFIAGNGAPDSLAGICFTPAGALVSDSAWSITGNTGTNSQGNFIGTADTAALSIRTKGAEAIHIDSSQRVGVGTSSPTALLQIGDGILPNGSFRYVDGDQAYGYVLTSDSLGNATWRPVPVPDTAYAFATKTWVDSSLSGFISLVDTSTDNRAIATPYYVDSVMNTNTGWGLAGNAGTNSGTNFLGTSDNASLSIATNGIQRMYMDSADGFVGVGTSTPDANMQVIGKFHVNGFGYGSDLLDSVARDIVDTFTRVSDSIGHYSSRMRFTEIELLLLLDPNVGLYSIDSALSLVSAAYDPGVTDSQEMLFAVGSALNRSVIMGDLLDNYNGTTFTVDDLDQVSTFLNCNVGIGTNSPAAMLDVEAYTGYGALLNGGNVGIGTNYPEAKLQIGDSLTGSATLKYIDGNQGANKVLTSDAIGNATWQNRNLPPVLDSVINLTSGTVTLTNNSYNIITASTTITSQTINFPSGHTGDRIEIKFTKGISTITTGGTGYHTVTISGSGGAFVAFTNYGGNWY